MLKMDQGHVLRHKLLKEGRSIRRVARELGISRNTVVKYLDRPEPEVTLILLGWVSAQFPYLVEPLSLTKTPRALKSLGISSAAP
jgi:predicted transcriptional regulator